MFLEGNSMILTKQYILLLKKHFLLSNWTSASLHINNAIYLCWVRPHLFGNFNPVLYLNPGGCGEQLIIFQYVKSFYKVFRTLEYERFCLWSSEALVCTSTVLSNIHPVSKSRVLHTPRISKHAGHHTLMLRPWLLYESFTGAIALLWLSSEPSVENNYSSAAPHCGSASCHSFLTSRLKSPSASFSFVLKIWWILFLSTELFC